MDFVKKAMASAKGDKSDKPATTEGSKPAGGDGTDYVDKGFAFASKKAGYNVDPKMQEKITDGGRTAYEKASGSKVDAKYSN